MLLYIALIQRGDEYNGEKTKRLIQLINEGKTINEISNELELSQKQLFNYLTMIKNKGFDFYRKYYANGDIIYEAKTKYGNIKQVSTQILGDYTDSELKIIIISDTHIGSKYERLDLLNEVYNYCINNNINIIFHCGDLIDATEESKMPLEDKIEYLLKKYPYDKQILNFITLGNHDLSPLARYGQNLRTVLSNYRHDLIALGYGHSIINVGEDNITLFHPLSENAYVPDVEYNKIIFQGHSHIFKVPINTMGKQVIYVPPLSDISIHNASYPSILEANLKFNSGSLRYITINQLIHINNKFTQVNEVTRTFKETDKPKTRIYTDTKLTSGNISQVDKFTKRYSQK